MAQKGIQLDQETISCSICLDLLKDPVTVSCGHSYCMKCLQTHWDTEDAKKLYSCPQCRQTFKPRPVLQKNTMLAVLVEELKKSGLQAAPADHCYAGAEDLVEPSKKLQENGCSERGERPRELEVSRQNIQQRIQDREKDVKLLQQEAEVINRSADKAVEDSQEIFTQLIRLMEKRRSDVTQQVRSQQESQVSRVKELEEKLRQEIAELKRRDGELQTLSQTQDHNQFLHDYPSLSALSQPTHSSSIHIRPLRYFEDVTATVSAVRDKLQDVLTETWTNISLTGTDVDVLLPQPEPKTREEFIRYSCDITLDPNTANSYLLLSDGNRKARWTRRQQFYHSHPNRFSGEYQVLSRESLTGRCYWEVERRGTVSVAVAYKNISRTGDESGFGYNDKSWALHCYDSGYVFWYNNVNTLVSGPWSSRVGVYLDHRAGILSFYSISETMTLLHRVHTTFTQSLHAGLWICGSTAEMCNLK
ncbi:tripartite motif-containing protein 16-like protein [Cheilinus undulatus]|uniref:tripartite motif-containing protein 16-like protein n=1 Tax=Cheilinus undulatus TaxID=241271 RepID=UPI001BD3312E|nr:tripartite motif-containing protein 16-like protein [Cheilinus undulatus]